MTVESSAQKVIFYIDKLTCLSSGHIILIAVSALMITLYLIISVLILFVHFEYRNIKIKTSAKLTSKNDIELLFTKTLLIILYEFLSKEKIVICILTMLISLYLFYNYYFYQPYYNKYINYLHIVLRFLFFWTCFVLFLCICLTNSKFQGGMVLFIFGIPIVFVGSFFRKNSIEFDLLMLPSDRITNGYSMLKRIKLFLYLVDRNDDANSRREQVILLGIIRFFESNCLINNCVLKQYLNDSKKEDFLGEKKILLLQHAELMYKAGIRKFPRDVKLRLSYGNFLYDKMKKRQKGLKEFENLQKYKPTFEEEFLIYKSRKLIEDEIDGESIDDGLDYVSTFAYKSCLTNFKSSIIKVSMYYIDFWSLLLLYDEDTNQHENFEKMSEIGKKISKLVIDIKDNFEKMEKINKNEPDVLKLYALFLGEVLNDEKKSTFYMNKLFESNEQRHKYDDNNLYNLNFKSLVKSEDYKYIILSAQNDSFGTISHISLNVCMLFGFLRNELIGQNLDMLLPEIYQEIHSKLLHSKFLEFKKVTISSSFGNRRDPVNSFHTSFKEINTFARNKSKYLIPIRIKTGLVSTEDGETYFISNFLTDVAQNWEEIENQVSYILTDNELMIQNFTSNAVKMLNLNSSSINNLVEITEFIKEFNEDFLRHVINMEEDYTQKKKQIKIHIINKKYRVPNEITWRLNENNPSNNFGSFRWRSSKFNFLHKTNEEGDNSIIDTFPKTPGEKRIFNNQSFGFINLNQKDGKNSDLFGNKYKSALTPLGDKSLKKSDLKFFLSVEDVIINKIQIGFLFKFETLSYYTKKRFKNTNSLLFSLKHSMGNLDLIKGSLANIKNLSKNYENGKDLNKLITGQRNSIFKKSGDVKDIINIHAPVIDPDYIPELQSQNEVFHINLKKMAFLPNKQHEYDKLRKEIKDLAIQKIATMNHGESSQDEEEEEEEEEEENEEENDSYPSEKSHETSSGFNEKEEINKNEEKKEKIKEYSLMDINKLKEYYQVDLTHINLLIYDFKRGGVSQTPYDKISEVDIKLKQSKFVPKDNVQNMEITLDETDKKEEISENGGHKQTKTGDNAAPNSQQKEKYNEKIILINLIKKALQNKEVQPSILNLLIVSFIIFGIIIAISIVSLIIFTNSRDKTLLFFQLILQSIEYHQNLIYSIFSVRELTILSNDKYTNLYTDDRDDYIHQMYTKAESYFISSSVILEDLSYILNNLNQNEKDQILSKNIAIQIIGENIETKNYSLQFFSALIENNMALYHVYQTEFYDITSINENVYYFLSNSLNDIMEISDNQVELFLQKFLNVTKKIKRDYYIGIGVIVAGYSLVYILFVFFFEKVEERKESYLSIFYQIGNTFIVTSLVKCEKFSQKIQIDKESENDSQAFESSSSNYDSFEEEAEKLALTVKAKHPKHDHKINKKNKKTHMNNVKYDVAFASVFLFLCLYSCLVFIVCLLLSKKYDKFAQFVYYQSKYQNRYLLLFTTIREVIFDYTMTIKSQNLEEYSNNELSSFYQDIKKEHEEIQKRHQYLPKEFRTFYDNVRTGNLCNYNLTSFSFLKTRNNPCEEFLYGTMTGGLYSLLTTFVEELRHLKEQYDVYLILAKNYSLNHNNSLYGTEYYEEFESTNQTIMEIYEKIDPINLFNSDTHKNLIITYSYIFKELFTLISTKMQESIEKYFNNNSNILYIMIWVFIGLVGCLYFFVLMPIEANLNEMIYKTKNMLSIIPREVLATLPQIKKMLNIDNSNTKSKQQKTVAIHT